MREINSDTPTLMTTRVDIRRQSSHMSQNDRLRHNPRLGTMVLVQARLTPEHHQMVTSAADALGLGRSEYVERLINMIRERFDGELPALEPQPRPRRFNSIPTTFYLSPESRRDLQDVSALTGAGVSRYFELLLDEAVVDGHLPAVSIESTNRRSKITAA